FVKEVPFDMMGVKSGDMELCKAQLDFIGINYYRRQMVSADPKAGDGTGVHNFDAHQGPLTDFAWEVWPDSFHDLVLRISNDYKVPIEITENGCSYLDSPDEHGRVPDQRRIDFTRGYLSALGRAMSHGANVRAYHHWSLLDNFEWAEGYAQRFGLVYVDFRSQKRTIKDSGMWYAELAKAGKLSKTSAVCLRCQPPRCTLCGRRISTTASWRYFLRVELCAVSRGLFLTPRHKAAAMTSVSGTRISVIVSCLPTQPVGTSHICAAMSFAARFGNRGSFPY